MGQNLTVRGDLASSTRLVVGIVGGPGSGAVLQRLLTLLPREEAFCYLVAVDLTEEDAFASKATWGEGLALGYAEEGAPLAPNTLYLVPSGARLEVREGALALSADEASHRGYIELFSLALCFGPRAVGVDLTGELGEALEAIANAGGLALSLMPDGTFVEAAKARADEKSLAVRLSLEDVPGALARFAKTTKDDETLAFGEQDILRLSEVLRSGSQLDVDIFKRSTVERRVRRRMALSGYGSFDGYLKALEVSRPAQRALIQDLLVGVTEMFREPEAFSVLRKALIEPRLREVHHGASSVGPGVTHLVDGHGLAPEAHDALFRAWVAGCGTGEEAYSVAIEVLEAAGPRPPRGAIQIYATDINPDAVQAAREGIYPASRLAALSDERRKRFFEDLGEGQYRVAAELREAVWFAVHDLSSDPPLPRMDLVSCRNLLIYLRPSVQEDVLRALHFGLKPGGGLFLGAAESLGSMRDLFEPVSTRWRIYKKLGDTRASIIRRGRASRVAARRFFVSGSAAISTDPRARGWPHGPEPFEARGDLVRKAVLRARVAPTVVVSQEDEILFAHGDLRRFLRLPEGEQPRLELRTLLEGDYAARALAVLHASRRQGASVVAVSGEGEGFIQPIRIIATPAFEVSPGAVILTFEALEIPGEGDEMPESGREDGGTGPRTAGDVATLEQELERTRQDLRRMEEALASANDELRWANEDLRSVNEELHASNDELDATAAELRASNAELVELNRTLSRRVEELARANDDIENLFESTRLASMFLDRDLRLVRSTPAARLLLDLDEHEVGRKLTVKRADPLLRDLEQEAQQVLDTLAPVTGELRDAFGRWFTREVRPYQTRARRVDGVVVSFSDITALKEAAVGRGRLAAIVEGSTDAILSVDATGVIESWNGGAERLFGFVESQAVGSTLTRFLSFEVAEAIGAPLARVVAGESVGPFETCIPRMDGDSVRASVSISAIRGDSGVIEGASIVARDVTKEARAREAEAHLAALVESSEDAILSLDFLGTVRSWNQGAERLYGYARAEMVGKSIYLLVPGERVAELRAALDRMERGEPIETLETKRCCRDGRLVDVAVTISPIQGPDGTVVAASTVDRDITARLAAQRALEESEQRHRSTFDSAAVGIAHVGFDGRFLRVNEQMSQITGYERDELLEKRFQDITHPEDVDKDVSQLRVLAIGTTDCYHLDKRYLRKDGTSVWVHLTVSLIRKADGRPDYFIAVVQDIAERKRLEEALVASEERLRVAAEVARVGTFEWQIASGNVVWQPALEALYGLPPGGFTGTYAAWAERVHPDDLPEAEASIQDALEHGILAAEWRAVWPDGSVRWLEARGWVERDPEGRPTRMVGVNLDITARKITDETVRRLDEQRRLSLESAQMGSWDLDLLSRIFHGDERVRDILGLSEDAVDLQVALSCIHPLDRTAVESKILEATDPRSGGAYDVEFRLPYREGPIRWVRAVGHARFEVRDGRSRATRFFGVMMDATARKEAERALRETKERYRLALEGGGFGTWSFDLERRESLWDERAKVIFGLAADKPVDLDEALLVIHPDDRAVSLAALERTLRTGEPYVVEKRLNRGAQGVRWVRTRGIVADLEDGEGRRLIGIVQDVTDQKEAEEALREASRRKDDYLAMLSHELRNPLAAIRTAGELVKAGAQNNPVMSRATAVLERQSRHMARLLDGLLDVSRITRGKLVIEKVELDLRVILDEVVSDFRSRLEKGGIELRLAFESRPLPILGDPTRLTQVFDNLLSNALKFTPPGGLIGITALVKDSEAVVEIEDTGAGFSPELGEHLFEPFQQGPQDISRAQGGLGLGLALARGIMELHGGRIHARSDGPGLGSVFTLVLPLREGAKSSPSEVVNGGLDRDSLHILLVEDNPDTADMLKGMLSLDGHAVEVATYGREGVEKARALGPDLVLCDIGLPGDMSGFDVARALRKDPSTHRLSLVAVTGYGRPEDKARAQEAGFDAHLTKPVDARMIQDAIARLRGARMSRS